MPEYVAPGVYVDELGVPPRSIAGVETGTAGFAGLTAYGPVAYPGGPSTAAPRLVTSFAEFEAIYGGITPLRIPQDADQTVPYLAHAARAFFFNGGTRLYVSRVFVPRATRGKADHGAAYLSIAVSRSHATWRARWPGTYGNASVVVHVMRGPTAAFQSAKFDGAIQVDGIGEGSLVEIVPIHGHVAADSVPTVAHLAQISIDAHDGRQVFNRRGAMFTPKPTDIIRHVTLTVVVTTDDNRTTSYNALETHPGSSRYVATILQRDHPEDPHSIVYLDWDPGRARGNDVAAHLFVALASHAGRLAHGHDGAAPSAIALAGAKRDSGTSESTSTGLAALGEIDDIAVVALPDAGALAQADECVAATSALIAHAEALRYRIAVIDPPQHSSVDAARRFRERFHNTYGALYFPWVQLSNEFFVPPSGAVCGVYARHDREHGVHKAPANEVLLGVTRLETSVTNADQEILNREGINALRDFPGRGHVVWGARTMSADPEWKYVNVRRFLIFLEHSMDRGTQWAAFEPNDEQLWMSVRRSFEDFLVNQWRSGALLGAKPEEAFFVRCDRTTMTQADLDNGRLVCLVGVAVLRPAEFVIFRIGQWTRGAHTP